MKKFLVGFMGVSAVFGLNIASSANQNDFIEACLSSSHLDRKICECTAASAEHELSSKGFDFLVASLRKEESTTTKLRSEMSMEEMISAGTFMTRGPSQCAQGH